jgi:hypothetical protein
MQPRRYAVVAPYGRPLGDLIELSGGILAKLPDECCGLLGGFRLSLNKGNYIVINEL